jgi:hypothetical protein
MYQSDFVSFFVILMTFCVNSRIFESNKYGFAQGQVMKCCLEFDMKLS